MQLELCDIASAIGATAVGSLRGTVSGVSIDSRAIRPGEIFFALVGKNHDAHKFVPEVLHRGASAAVVSRPVEGVPPGRVLLHVADTLAALSDLARWVRARTKATLIGVTGSNGKTTTREMIHAVLRDEAPTIAAEKSYNTDIGVSLTLFRLEPETRYGVLEMGINEPGEMDMLQSIAKPDIAVLTCVAACHLEGFGTEERIAREKAVIFRDAKYAVFNLDNPWAAWAGEQCRCEKVSFGLGSGAAVRGSNPRRTSEGVAFEWEGRTVSLPVMGLFNVHNALAAIALGVVLGVERDRIVERLPRFERPKMRMQAERLGEAMLLLDCYNANPYSMAAALDELDAAAGTRRVVICGDMFELGAETERLHRELGRRIARSRADIACFIGERMRFAHEEASRLRGGCQYYATKADFLKAAPIRLQAGDVVLVKGSRAMGLEEVAASLRP